jgi:hypothetical protein
VPSNDFRYARLSSKAKHGVVTLRLSVPGKGKLVVMETALDLLLTHPAHGHGIKKPKRTVQRQSGLKPGPDRFTFATATKRVSNAGKLTLRIKPSKNGARAAKQNPHGFRINVRIIYTPTGGHPNKQMSLRFSLTDLS